MEKVSVTSEAFGEMRTRGTVDKTSLLPTLRLLARDTSLQPRSERAQFEGQLPSVP